MSSLASIINNLTVSRSHQPLVILQSSNAQTSVPILRKVISSATSSSATLLFTFLYPPSSLVDGRTSPSLQVFDYTGHVPGYDTAWIDPRDEILATVTSAAAGSITVILDSIDTLVSDVSSTAQTYKFIQTLLQEILARSQPSVLVLHLLSHAITALLLQTSFSPTLLHLVAHPSSLLTHVSTTYLTLPPPAGTPEKFWSVFIPVTERTHDSERLVFGTDGHGSNAGVWSESSGAQKGFREFVVEVLVRNGGGEGRKRGVERTLYGWKGNAPCELAELDSLKSLRVRKRITEFAPNPIQNVSFNLTLTPSQEKSRSEVPLPYAHEGKPSGVPISTPAAILYDPDSADDIDDDDPDEDLDI
ncbi:hypothetical protein BJ138DRAFT_877442 [Hygrophoropsis aurantiaca]|uniref:Uncharacterized protein n=1 Tax=Hygrophoropsis aurantiaca TaxID=72124 RepID=A0ACB8ARF8_9AGAM|nr:hypothetical protein BJ138DRAFT_877442 [Hygrophoropsis aurantiaca]